MLECTTEATAQLPQNCRALIRCCVNQLEQTRLSKPAQLRPPETIIAITLTLVAGYVDAAGFLKLGGIYVANMSGNSVAIGIRTAEKAWPELAFRLWPVACYTLGLICARAGANLATSFHLRRIAAPFFLLETILLLLFMQSMEANSGIFFAALAMGVQAATISRFNGVTVYTAFVTGSLVRFAETFSEWLGGLLKPDREPRKQALRDAFWFLAVWLAYVCGAAIGAAAFIAAGVKTVLFACGVLIALAIRDLIHPAEFNTEA